MTVADKSAIADVRRGLINKHVLEKGPELLDHRTGQPTVSIGEILREREEFFGWLIMRLPSFDGLRDASRDLRNAFQRSLDQQDVKRADLMRAETTSKPCEIPDGPHCIPEPLAGDLRIDERLNGIQSSADPTNVDQRGEDAAAQETSSHAGAGFVENTEDRAAPARLPERVD